MQPTNHGLPLSSLYWLPLAERSRTLAAAGIHVTWYIRPPGGLHLGLPHVAVGPPGED